MSLADGASSFDLLLRGAVAAAVARAALPPLASAGCCAMAGRATHNPPP